MLRMYSVALCQACSMDFFGIVYALHNSAALSIKIVVVFSPPTRWGSLDFIRVACLLPSFLLLPPHPPSSSRSQWDLIANSRSQWALLDLNGWKVSWRRRRDCVRRSKGHWAERPGPDAAPDRSPSGSSDRVNYCARESQTLVNARLQQERDQLEQRLSSATIHLQQSLAQIGNAAIASGPPMQSQPGVIER